MWLCWPLVWHITLPSARQRLPESYACALIPASVWQSLESSAVTIKHWLFQFMNIYQYASERVSLHIGYSITSIGVNVALQVGLMVAFSRSPSYYLLNIWTRFTFVHKHYNYIRLNMLLAWSFRHLCRIIFGATDLCWAGLCHSTSSCRIYDRRAVKSRGLQKQLIIDVQPAVKYAHKGLLAAALAAGIGRW